MIQPYKSGIVYPKDRVVSEALGLGSALGRLVPGVAEKIGRTDHPDYVALRWHFARWMASSDVARQWIKVPGAAAAGHTPASYPEALVMRFPRDPLDEYADRFKAEHAVAYVLGHSAAMVGTRSNREILSADPDDSSNYAIAMRIGEGVLQALPGVRLPRGNFATLPLERMNISVERLPLADVHNINVG